MAGQRLGGGDRRTLRAEHAADRLDLLEIADRRRGGVRIDVVDRRLAGVERHVHAAHRALARGRHHVVAVGGRAVAGDLGIDLGAARLGVFELFQHQHAGAAGDDEAVAVHVVGARGLGRRVVVFRRHGAHGVEQHRERPVQLFAAAGEDHVLLAPLNDFGGIADAMIGGRAGRRDRIVHALDLEPGGERRRSGGRHRFRHREWADALGTLAARDVGGLDDRARRKARPSPSRCRCARWKCLFLRRRNRGSPAPWRHGSRRRRRRGSAWRGDRPTSAGSSVGAPCTWQRKPSSAYSSAREMPDLASRRLARTSCVLLPMDETMPIPVTTTRLIAAYPHSRRELPMIGRPHDWPTLGPPQAPAQDRGSAQAPLGCSASSCLNRPTLRSQAR